MKATKSTFEKFPEWVIEKWQDITDVLAETIDVPAVLIRKVDDESLVVVISSHSEGNPYQPGNRGLITELYCNGVIKTQNSVMVTDGRACQKSLQNSDLNKGMAAYLGFSLKFSDNKLFGTLCVLDKKGKSFSASNERLIRQFKNVIELDLAILQSFDLQTSRPTEFLSLESIERNRVKEALRTCDLEFKAIFSNTPDHIFQQDRNLRYNLVINPQLGLSEAEMIGKTDFDILEREDADKLTAIKMKVMSTGNPYPIQTSLRNTQGGIEFFDGTYIARYNSENQIDGVIGYFKNITTSVLYEEKLSKSEQRYRSLLNNLEAGIVVHAPDTSIIMNNPRAAVLLGLSDDQLKGKEAIDPSWKFVDSDKVPLPYEAYPVNRILKDKQPIKNQIVGSFQPGKHDVVWLTVNGFPVLDKTGELKEIVISFIDITWQKQSEIILFNEKKRIKTILDMVGDPIFVKDNDHNIILANKAFQDLFGVEEKDVIGKTLAENIPEEDLKRFFEVDRRVLDTGISEIREEILTVKNERKTFITIKTCFIEDCGTKFLVGSIHDITELKQIENDLIKSENELKRQNELFYSLIKNLPMGVFMVEAPSCKPLVFNEMALKLLDRGIIPDVAVRDLSKEYHVFSDDKGNSYPTEEMPIVRGMKGESTHIDNMLLIKPDGSKTQLEVFGSPVCDEKGNVWASLVSFSDITHRKQLEDVQSFLITCGYSGSNDNFFESLAKYLSKILDSEYVCIDKIEGEGLTAQTVAIYNEEKFETNVSYTLKQTPCGEVVGKTICCFPENVCQLFPYDEALQVLKAQSYIGTTLWSSDGKPIGLIAVIGKKAMNDPVFAENVLKTVALRAAGELERQSVEDELRLAKEKAEESDRLKSSFLANMSHEIRTPMNGILGFAEILQDTDLTGEEQQEYIRIIQKSGIRMLNIINDIIDISKIESGLMKIHFKESNINEQIEYIYTFFKPEVLSKGMKLSFHNSLPASEALIRTDREKVYAIFTNLVKNAIKYSIEGEIRFGYQKIDNSLEFFVRDTGIGIPKNRLDSVFERFIQADNAEKMARQGAGLGLTIAKSYVEMLGGKIWVESEEGVGSTFYFTLPYDAEINKKNLNQIDPLTVTTKLNISNLKILIAEDDDISARMLTININEYSNQITRVRTGQEAVEICQKNSDIDLILMDIQMPVLNGYEATRLIRKFNKEVFIIAQTAFGNFGDREKAIEAGCNDYIAKPISKYDLFVLIKKYLKN